MDRQRLAVCPGLFHRLGLANVGHLAPDVFGDDPVERLVCRCGGEVERGNQAGEGREPAREGCRGGSDGGAFVVGFEAGSCAAAVGVSCEDDCTLRRGEIGCGRVRDEDEGRTVFDADGADGVGEDGVCAVVVGVELAVACVD